MDDRSGSSDDDEQNDDDDDDNGGKSVRPAVARNSEIPVHHNRVGLGIRAADVDLRASHVSSAQSQLLWQIYAKHTDPLIKILHLPEVAKILSRMQQDLSSLKPANEALVFSMYSVAMLSVEDKEVTHRDLHTYSNRLGPAVG